MNKLLREQLENHNKLIKTSNFEDIHIDHKEVYKDINIQVGFLCDCHLYEDPTCGEKFYLTLNTKEQPTYTDSYVYSSQESALNAAKLLINSISIPKNFAYKIELHEYTEALINICDFSLYFAPSEITPEIQKRISFIPETKEICLVNQSTLQECIEEIEKHIKTQLK